MKNYKKTLIGSFVAFVIGTSCCWITSLAVWLGGAVVFGAAASFIESKQTGILAAGMMLLIVSMVLYFRHRRQKDR